MAAWIPICPTFPLDPSLCHPAPPRPIPSFPSPTQPVRFLSPSPFYLCSTSPFPFRPSSIGLAQHYLEVQSSPSFFLSSILKIILSWMPSMMPLDSGSSSPRITISSMLPMVSVSFNPVVSFVDIYPSACSCSSTKPTW